MTANTSTVPVLVERDYGGWLAVSESGSRIRIGVIGDSEGEARSKFAATVAEWEKLLDEPGSYPTE